MSYGYVGDTSTSIKQQVKNAGVLSVSDVLDLEGKGQLGGSLEFIEEQTISSSYADFTSLKEDIYDVHVFHFKNVVPNSTTNIGMRFSNDGGSSYINSAYEYSWRRGYPSSHSQINSSSKSRILINGDIGTNAIDGLDAYIYCYNLGNSSKYSSCSFHSIGSSSTSIYAMYSFGGGALPTAETHNAVRFGTLDFAVLTSGSIKLYGVKQ